MELTELWKESLENARKIRACHGHIFVTKATRFLCKNCGGDVDSSARIFYEQGLAHAAMVSFDTTPGTNRVNKQPVKVLRNPRGAKKRKNGESEEKRSPGCSKRTKAARPIRSVRGTNSRPG